MFFWKVSMRVLTLQRQCQGRRSIVDFFRPQPFNARAVAWYPSLISHLALLISAQPCHSHMPCFAQTPFPISFPSIITMECSDMATTFVVNAAAGVAVGATGDLLRVSEVGYRNPSLRPSPR